MKIIISGLLSISVCLSAGAATLTPEAALSRLNRETPGKMKIKSNLASPKLLHTAYDENGEPALYIFTYSGDKGFMILSAEENVTALLGYSETNSFGIPGLPLEQNPFINQYVSEVGATRAAGTRAAEDGTYSGTWEYIAPMVKALWNQFDPYNRELDGKATGCIATAMAEFMKYWEYPERGTGTVTDGTTIILDDMPFDWANMLDTYETGKYNDTQATAVATLMKAAGFAMGLEYKTGASKGNPTIIQDVLMTNFLYAPGATYFFRGWVNSDYEWNEALYNNLKEYGPVIYSDSDHTYICDGYNGEGLFHFNFGGSGYGDGWYIALESHSGHKGGHCFSGNLRPGTAELNVTKASINDVALTTGTNTVGNISYLNLDLNLSYKTNGRINSYLYLQITQGGETVYKTVFDGKITQQYGTLNLAKQLILPELNPGEDYTLTLQYYQYGNTAPTTLATYTIQGAEQTTVNPWEGVDSVDVADGQFTISLTGLSPETAYSYTLYAVAGDLVSAWVELPFNTLAETSGVEGLLNSDEPVRYYNLEGIEISKPEPGTICIVRQGTKSYKLLIK